MAKNLLKILMTFLLFEISFDTLNEYSAKVIGNYKHPVVTRMESEYELKKYNELISDLEYDRNVNTFKKEFFEMRIDSNNYNKEQMNRCQNGLKYSNLIQGNLQRELKVLNHKRDSVLKIIN